MDIINCRRKRKRERERERERGRARATRREMLDYTEVSINFNFNNPPSGQDLGLSFSRVHQKYKSLPAMYIIEVQECFLRLRERVVVGIVR